MGRKRKEFTSEEIDVVDFCASGLGLGLRTRQDGACDEVEIPFTIPGDRALIQRGPKRRGRYPAKLLQILHSSPDRTIPRCTHFGSCGGCIWQHMPYARQLKIKDEQIRKLFCNSDKEAVYHPIIPCSPPWQYRNKMEFSFSQNKMGTRFLGLLLAGGKGKVFNNSECHLANSWFVTAAEIVKKWWESTDLEAYHHSQDRGSLRNLTLREGLRTGDRMVTLLVSGNPDYALKQSHLQSFLHSVRTNLQPAGEGRLSVFVRIQQIAKGHPTQYYEMHLAGPDHICEELFIENSAGESQSFRFTISPTSFFQPNTAQAEKLYSRAIQMAAKAPLGEVYDLYCGTATLGVLLAPHARSVLGVEICKEAILDARANIQNNHLSNIEVVAGDVGAVLAARKEGGRSTSPELLLLDPPRVGLDEQAMQQVLHLAAEKILYISCNPRTQAANIERLCNEGGYVLSELQPVDQFPHTIHVENIALLKKKPHL